MELEADIRLVQIAVEMVDPSGVEGRLAPLDAVDELALARQLFGEVRVPCPATSVINAVRWPCIGAEAVFER
jgi:hypothetical protein